MSGEHPVSVVNVQERSGLEKAINGLSGAVAICTLMLCITLIVCAFIVS